MKLEECKSLKKGEKVMWRLGNGWYMTGKYVRLVEVTTFQPMTLSDLMGGSFSLENGKKSLKAQVEYTDNGQTRFEYISTRKLHKV